MWRVALVGLFLCASFSLARADNWPDLMAAAQSAHQREDFERAAGYLVTALDIAESFAADDDRLATNLFALGSVLFDQERFEAAISPLARAIAAQERVHGTAHRTLGSMLNALALVHTRLGDYERAVPLYERALAILEAAHGLDHLSVARVLKNLGGIYLDEARYEKAATIFQRAIPVLERDLGRRDQDLILSLQHYALVLRNLGRDDEADALDAEIIESLE